MRSSPRTAVFTNGERFPYLEDGDGLMSYWPTLFTVAMLRGVGKAANTINNELQAISHLRLWEQLEGRDLFREFSEQQFPSEEDILSLRDHCFRDSADLKKYMARAKQLTKSPLNQIAPVNQTFLKTVRKSHAYNRLTVIGKYLYFCAVIRTNRSAATSQQGNSEASR